MNPTQNENPAGIKETGSPQAQISFLTQHINRLSQHLGGHKRDFSSQRGLLKLVSQRRHMLKYLAARDVKKYREVIQTLDLRK